MNSASVRTGSFGFTAMMLGISATSEIAVKSLRLLNPGLR